MGAAAAILGVVLLIGLLGEGAGHLAHPVVPQPQPAEVGLRGPLLDLPTDGAADRVWQYFSTNGFYKIPIGNSTFEIPQVDDLRGGMSGFPDKASIEKLRYYGHQDGGAALDDAAAAGDPRVCAGGAAERAGGGGETGGGAGREAPPGGLAGDL